MQASFAKRSVGLRREGTPRSIARPMPHSRCTVHSNVRHVQRLPASGRRFSCPPQCVAAPVKPYTSSPQPLSTEATTAVVIGGSITGSITAQAISKTFDRVLILERDSNLAPKEVMARKGVPQYRQPHVMLLKGLAVLDDLWPGFRQQMYKAGGLPVDFGRDIRSFHVGDWVQQYEYDAHVKGVSASRALVEDNVRQRLRTNDKVEILPGSVVTGLQYDAENKQVTGVQMKGGDVISADLVIDASGRGSKSPQWLQDMGYQAPPEVAVNADIVYATATVKPRNDLPPKILMCFTQPFTHGIVVPIEEGLYQVIFAGVHAPPANREAFLEWASTELPVPFVREFLDQCNFIMEPANYNRTGNVLRKYEECPQLPDGLVMVGDAVAAFNPVYGQGMSCGAMAAETLANMLHKRTNGRKDAATVRDALKGMSKIFQSDLAAALAFPWTMATAQDSKLVGEKVMSKPPSASEKFVSAYLDTVMVASRKDPVIHRQFTSVMHMVAPPTAMFTLPIASRVLWFLLLKTFKAVPSVQPRATSVAQH